MAHKFLIIKYLLVFVFVLLLSACSEHDKTNEPKRQLNFATVGVVKSLDPALAADVISRNMAGAIFDTLVQYNYLERPYKLEPSMLAKMPSISDDNCIYHFELRQDLYFHDDKCFNSFKERQVTVDDVIFSFKRVIDPNMYSPVYWIFRDRILGINEFRNSVSQSNYNGVAKGYPLELKGLRKINDFAFEIELSQPDPRFLYFLAMPAASVVSKKAAIYYKNDLSSHPIGSGAFRLKEWKKNYQIRLAKHQEYRSEYFQDAKNPADRTRKLPLADEVVYNIIKKPFTAWLLFLQGELDMSALDKDNLDILSSKDGSLSKALTDRGISLVQAPAFEIRYVAFNMLNDKFGKNPNLRKAISCAYNVERRIQFSSNQLLMANSPVIIGVDGYDKNLKNPYSFNLELAKYYLEKAGYKDGIDPNTSKPLEIDFDLNGSSSMYLQLGELFASDMNKLGIKVNVNLNSSPRFFEKVRRGETEMFFISWVGDYPDAENFLQLFYSKRIGSSNRAGYSDVNFDKMFEEIIGMKSSEKRTSLYKEMAKYIVEQCVWIYDGVPMNFQLTHSFLENFYPHNFNFGTLKYLSVDPKNRQKQKKNFKPLNFKELK